MALEAISMSWAWSSLKKPAADLAVAVAKKRVSKGSEQIAHKAASAWTELKWDDAENIYRQKLLALVRTTKVLGHPTAIEIDKIYTDAYVFDKLSAIRRYSDSLDEDEIDVHARLDDRERVQAKSLILGGKNTFILGRPGAGKTTLLKYLAMSSCKGLIARTPVLVPLKDWSDSALSLMAYVCKQFDICGFPDANLFLEAMFRAGKALVLFDGLDEVNEWHEKRNQVIKEIVNFSDKYSKNQYCLTCRTAATDYSFDSFQYVEVADFNSAQQEQFASQWYGKSSPTLKRFIDAWRDPRNSGFRDLGRTPLLLTLLCLAFDETHSFPKRQIDLYQEAINALLKKWDASRLIIRDDFYHQLSHGQRVQLLETIAADFYFNSKTVFRRAELATVCVKFVNSLPGTDASSVIDGGEIVRQIEAQHGLIIERAHGLHTFSHLTIQEYFTASFISRNQNSVLQRQIVKSALHDQKWREVMLYTISLLPQADSVLAEMQSQIAVIKRNSSGVMIFLLHCYCTAKLASVNQRSPAEDSPKVDTQEYYFSGVRNQIETYVEAISQPSLTTAELAKFVEHIDVLQEFLKARQTNAAYAISVGVVNAAVRFLRKDALDAAKLLGGYFVKAEQFVSFFYACRLLMECLDVAITSKRESYLADLFTFTQSDIERVEQVISSTR